MSHLHFPDGVLPLLWWIGGFAVIAALLAIALWQLRSTKDAYKTYPLIGLFSAVMIIGMSFEIIPLGYHLNFAVPAGIILGPAGVIVAAFITNLFLALIGHGGVTVIGINATSIALQGIMGYALFRLGRRWVNAGVAGFVASAISLVITTALVFGVIALSVPGEFGKNDEGEMVLLSVFMVLGGIGMLIESTLSGFLLGYLARLKPELLPRR